MTGLSVTRSGRPLRVRALAGTIAATLAAIGLAMLVSTQVADISPVAPIGAALFLILPVWLFVNRRVEVSLVVLVVYLGLVDGVLKLMTNVEASTLGRDLLLYTIVAGMLARAVVERRDLRVPPLTGWVLAWILVVIVQLLNPADGSLTHSLAALRQHLEFVPLFFVGFLVMTSAKRLRVFLTVMLALAAINGVVGLLQSGLTPDQLSGWGPGYAALFTDVGTGGTRTFEGVDGEERVRPPGLGSDFGFAGVLGALALPGGLALLLMGRRNARMLPTVGLALLAVVAVLTSQSRSAVIVAIVASIFFAGLAILGRQASRTIVGMGLAGALIFLAVAIVSDGNNSALSRYESIAPNRVLQTTIESRSGTIALIPDYLVEFPFGAGIGSVGPIAGQIGRPTKNTPNAESQFTFLIAEVGIPGLLVFLAFQLRLLGLVITRLRRLRDREVQLLLAGLAAPLFALFVNWIVGVNTTSTPNAPYLWFAAGVLSYWLVARASGPRRPAPAGAA